MCDKKTNVLIIDDDRKFIMFAKKMLHEIGEFHFDEGNSESDFYSLFRAGKYHAIILDLRLKSGYEGMQLLEYALNEDPAVPIIIMTGYASVETAIKSLKLGAKDYLEKQHLKEKEFKTEFLKKLNRIIIEDKARKMADKMLTDYAVKSELIGNDIKIKRIVTFADKFAESKESPILLVGEMGTEKEQLAKYIHKISNAKGQFIKKIVSSEEKDSISKLFGDDKSDGLIKKAQAGVLYLEDVFKLDFEAQQSLLEFIDTGKLKRKGKTHEQAVKVQIILSSTNSSEQLLKIENISSDFYYRVKTPEILIPPLRERGDDISILAKYYLSELKNNGKTTADSVSSGVLEMFQAYPWPGNRRELKHIIELSGLNALLANDKVIKPTHLPANIQKGTTEMLDSTEINLDKILAETSLKYMRIALQKSNGAKIEAYQHLGYPESKRGTLNARLKKHFSSYPELALKYNDIYQLYKEKER